MTIWLRADAAGVELPHLRVQHRIAGDLATGALRPGDRLAPERELALRYGVARNTLRRALQDLGERGLIEASGRRGWHVRDACITETLTGPQGLTEWGSAHALSISSTVIAAHVRPATEKEAVQLRLQRGASVFELERVRRVDGSPLSLDRAVLVGRLAPTIAGIDFATASLYAALRGEAGIQPSRSDLLLRAVLADTRTAALLEVEAGAAVLELAEVVFDQYGEPFETAVLLNRGDRYAFRTSLTSGDPHPAVPIR